MLRKPRFAPLGSNTDFLLLVLLGKRCRIWKIIVETLVNDSNSIIQSKNIVSQARRESSGYDEAIGCFATSRRKLQALYFPHSHDLYVCFIFVLILKGEISRFSSPQGPLRSLLRGDWEWTKGRWVRKTRTNARPRTSAGIPRCEKKDPSYFFAPLSFLVFLIHDLKYLAHIVHFPFVRS